MDDLSDQPRPDEPVTQIAGSQPGGTRQPSAELIEPPPETGTLPGEAAPPPELAQSGEADHSAEQESLVGLRAWARSRTIAAEGGGRLRGVRARLTAAAGPRVADATRRWSRRGLLAVFAVCLMLGVAGAVLPPPSPSPSVGGIAGASPTPAAVSPTHTASIAPANGTPPLAASASATPQQTPTPTTELSPQPIPSQTSPTATVTFNDLVLDSTADPAAQPRTFTFASDGPGIVSVQVVAATTTASSKLCVSVDGGDTNCVSGAAPGFPAEIATKEHSRWTVTIASANEGSPTVDVAFRWPASSPSITLNGGRFQGAPNPDVLRSLTATFVSRFAGSVTLAAAWPPVNTNATLTLTTAGSPNRKVVDQVRYLGAGSILPAYAHAIAAGTEYRLALMNDGTEGLRPSLSATISFP